MQKLTWKQLVSEPTNDPVIQFVRYVFVGGCSFLVDAGVLWLITRTGLHYLIAAIFGFVAGLLCNYFLSKLFVFQKEAARVTPFVEFLAYAIIGLIGLALTEALLFFFTDIVHLYFMISKVISAAIVLIWNFLARKLLLYRKPARE